MSVLLIFARIHPFQAEGSSRRVQYIDQRMTDISRRYLVWDNEAKTSPLGKTVFIDEKCSQITLSSYNPMHWLVFIALVLRAGALYIHSLYGTANLMGRLALKLRFFQICRKKVIWDAHGVVPEELQLLGHHDQVAYFSRLENELACAASAIIVVSEAMKRHFLEKYRHMKNTKFLVIPILPIEIPVKLAKKAEFAVYCGGGQAWQCPDKIVLLLTFASRKMETAIFSSDVGEFRERLVKAGNSTTRLLSVSGPELASEYNRAKFGLLIREDHIVNQVSCPTKLGEYLAHGVLPVMNHAHIGDFSELGMKFVSIKDFADGRLPDEDSVEEFSRVNRLVLESLQKLGQVGVQSLREQILE